MEKAFDARVLVSRCLGDEETAKYIAAAFLEDTPRQIAKLSDAIQHSDLPAAKFAAHAIRGSAGLVGGQRIADIAGKLESLGDTGSFAIADQLVGDLQACFDSLRSGLSDFCQYKG